MHVRAVTSSLFFDSKLLQGGHKQVLKWPCIVRWAVHGKIDRKWSRRQDKFAYLCYNLGLEHYWTVEVVLANSHSLEVVVNEQAEVRTGHCCGC